MFEIAKDARLMPHDLAKILKINRITVSMWFNGHSKPHRFLQDRVEKLLDVIRLAVEAGDLPVPHDVTRRERAHYIQKVLSKHSGEAETQEG